MIFSAIFIKAHSNYRYLGTVAKLKILGIGQTPNFIRKLE